MLSVAPEYTQNQLFMFELFIEVINCGEHPVPAKDISQGFRVYIPGIRVGNAGVLIQHIVELRFDNQFVLKEIPAHIAVPE